MTRQLELLRPAQIREAMDEMPLIWIPLGTIEWHCEHLPVGLDAATAHALCVAAAEKAGGLVYPTLYYGTGGDHSAYPWTIMMPSSNEIEAILDLTLRRLSDLGVQRCVLFSGHFADEQIDMIDRLAESWNAGGLAPRVTATSVNQCPTAGMPPDHAGEFETTLLTGIAPETVNLSRLPSLEDAPDTGDRHDPQNPIWGVIGSDPRITDVVRGPELFGRLAEWLASQSR